MGDTEPNRKIALKYARYHQLRWQECDSVDRAVSSAHWMQDDGQGVPIEVVTLCGEVLLDGPALEAAIEQYEAAMPEPVYKEPDPIPDADAAAAEAFTKFMGTNYADAYDWNHLDEAVKAVWRSRVAQPVRA